LCDLKVVVHELVASKQPRRDQGCPLAVYGGE
jgi:hypothetical protein